MKSHYGTTAGHAAERQPADNPPLIQDDRRGLFRIIHRLVVYRRSFELPSRAAGVWCLVVLFFFLLATGLVSRRGLGRGRAAAPHVACGAS